MGQAADQRPGGPVATESRDEHDRGDGDLDCSSAITLARNYTDAEIGPRPDGPAQNQRMLVNGLRLV